MGARRTRVGTTKEWLAIDDIQGFLYSKRYKLRAKGDHIEVWVVTGRSPVCDGDPATECPVDEDTVVKGTQFLPGDCRNDERVKITDKQVRYLKRQFDRNIYPKEVRSFSRPPNRNGSDALLYSPGAGAFRKKQGYYRGGGDNTVVLVDNVRDDNYYDQSNSQNLPYIAGFFYSAYNEFFDRNVMTIDAYDWIHRTHANPPDQPVPGDNCNSKPARPYLYESTFAHEWQHLLEYYEDPDEVTWVNEGLSDWAQTLTGYAEPATPITDSGFDSHIQCYLGWLEVQTAANPNPRSGGPENSLNLWDEQDEILCDYGAAYSFMEFLRFRYGRGFMRALHQHNGNGLAGLQELLEDVADPQPAEEVLHEWLAAMALDGVLDDGAKLLNASASVYRIGRLDSFINWANDDTYSEPGAPPNGADFVRLRDASGGFISSDDLGSLTFDGSETLEPIPVEWTVDDDPPSRDSQALFSGSGENFDRTIATEVGVPQNDPTLRFDTFFEAEEDWDYGFVQISTDGGQTWTSLSNADTDDDSDPSAVPQVQSNLPGFTGSSGCPAGSQATQSCDPSWVEQSFDLSAHAGDDILVGFRYVTDGAVNGAGWWIDDVEVGNRNLSQGTSVNDWQTYSELDPDSVEGFTLQLIAYNDAHTQASYANIPLGAGFTASLDDAALASMLSQDAEVVAALVTYDESTEEITQYAPYTLTVNGVTQPGGS